MMNPLQILQTEIVIGIEKPIKLLHMSDTHLVRDDERPSGRRACFESEEGAIERYFFSAVNHARENGLPILHTGDLIDYTSQANLAFVDAHFSGLDYLYAAGNHDFCHWVGEAREDDAYKAEQLRVCAPHFHCDLFFDSRVIGGVNFVTMDDSYYRIKEEQLDLLRAEAARGYPIILCMHVPLFTPDRVGVRPVLYVVGAPEEILATYPEQRRRQQAPDAATLRAVDYIKSEPLIRAVLAGHTHENRESDLTPDKKQYVTGGTYLGLVREITVR